MSFPVTVESIAIQRFFLDSAGGALIPGPRRQRVFTLLRWLIAGVLALATASAMARPIALEDINRLEELSGPRLSPDGSAVAYTLSTRNLDSDASVSDIWVVRWSDGQRRKLTDTAFNSEWQAQWRPDGKALAFLSDDTADDSTQIKLVAATGGKPRTLSRMPGGVEDFVWAPDGKRIALIATDPAPVAGKDSRGEDRPASPIEIDRFLFKEDGRDYLAAQRLRLYILDVASGRTTVLSGADEDVWLPSWSPDGKSIAFVAKRGADPDRTIDFDVYVMAPQAGAPARRISRLKGADSDPYWESRPDWSPDSRKLVWLQSGDDKWVNYEPWQLVVADLDSGELSTPGRIDRSFYQPRWSADGQSLYALIEQPEHTWLARIDLASDRIDYLSSGNRVAYEYDIAANGRIALLQSDEQTPGAIYALPGEPRLLSGHNEWLREVELRESSDLVVQGADGTEVHAMLTTPAGYDGKSPLPTIVRLHGGPVYQFSHEFMYDWQLYAAHGYAVLGINPRGSSGRGFDFARAIYADWGNLDVKDVLAVVDHAIAIGVADPKRLGVGGRSYGGILTNYVIASDPRFAAAVSEAGSSNMFGMYGVDQYSASYEIELGTPWNNTDAYMRVSYPFFHVDRIVTPTLFMCLQSDFNVPCAGAEQMYQALRSTGVATRLILYPGQNHQPTVPSYLYHRQKLHLAWYDKYLGKP